MKIVWALIIKDWKSFRADKTAVLLTFLVPIMVIFVIGNIFGIGAKGSNPGPSGLRLAVVDETHSEIVAKMIEAIDADKAFRVIRGKADENEAIIPFSEQDVRDGILNNEYRFALVFPKDSISQGFGFTPSTKRICYTQHTSKN